MEVLAPSALPQAVLCSEARRRLVPRPHRAKRQRYVLAPVNSAESERNCDTARPIEAPSFKLDELTRILSSPIASRTSVLRLAELPEVAIGEVSVTAFSQMANPEKQHLAKSRSRFDRCYNVLPLRTQRPLLGPERRLLRDSSVRSGENGDQSMHLFGDQRCRRGHFLAPWNGSLTPSMVANSTLYNSPFTFSTLRMYSFWMMSRVSASIAIGPRGLSQCSAKHHRIGQAPHGPSPNRIRKTASTMLLPLTAMR